MLGISLALGLYFTLNIIILMRYYEPSDGAHLRGLWKEDRSEVIAIIIVLFFMALPLHIWMCISQPHIESKE